MNNIRVDIIEVEIKEWHGKKILALACYNQHTFASFLCNYCDAGLCTACGYVEKDGDKHFCNECWKEYQEDELGICAECGTELEPIYENNGFTAPDPTMIEITGHKPCLNCKGENL